MVSIPKDIIEMMPQATKTIITVSKDGQPHGIVAGSIIALGDSKIAIGEVLMKRTKENLAANGKAAILVTAGPKSFELVLKNAARADSGEVFEAMKANLAKANFPCFGVWTFDVAEVWDESAGPNAGKKLC